MPSEHDYRSAAHHFRAVASELADNKPTHWMGFASTGVDSMWVNLTMSAGVIQVARQMGAAIDELHSLANECERRASICRSYRLRWRRWLNASATERELMDYPYKPASWVSR